MGEPTEQQAWRLTATPDMHRVATAANRLSVSVRLNETTMLAAADELQAATRTALRWLAANPCPDHILGNSVAAYLNASAEVAFVAQQAASDENGNHAEHLRRVQELLEVIATRSRTIGSW